MCFSLLIAIIVSLVVLLTMKPSSKFNGNEPTMPEIERVSSDKKDSTSVSASIDGASNSVSASIDGASNSVSASIDGASNSVGSASIDGVSNSPSASIDGVSNSVGASIDGVSNSPSASIDGASNSAGASIDGASNSVGASIDGVSNSPSDSIDGVSNSVGASIDSVSNSPSASIDGVSNSPSDSIDGVSNSPSASIDGASNSVGASIDGVSNSPSDSIDGASNSVGASIDGVSNSPSDSIDGASNSVGTSIDGVSNSPSASNDGARLVTATTTTQVKKDSNSAGASNDGARLVTATTTTQVKKDSNSAGASNDGARLVTDTNVIQVRHQLQPFNNKGNHFGYVLANNYYDQQTAALKNLLSLQCWAAQLNMPVVEPFMVKSIFQTPLKTNVSDLLRFSDFYDMEQWNEGYVKPNSFLPFASWEDFVYTSPRDVILVQILTRGGTCSFPSNSEFFKKHHFRIVREACVSLNENKPMTTDEFNHLVLNEYYKLRNVTVILASWRGICVQESCQSQTISTITDSKCDRWTLLNPGIDIQLNVSKRVNQDADLYVHRYLNNSSYISVMLRLEYPIVTTRETDIVSKCIKGAQDTWKRLKNENQLNVTFLTWDIGRFGSARFEIQKIRWKAYEITKNAQPFFTAVYGNSTSEKEWENTLVDVSGNNNTGYIALLQMSIAVRARCIVLVGGGSFQRHALKMYTDMHPQTQTQCIATLSTTCD